MKRKSVTVMTIFIVILTMISSAAPQIPGMDINIPDIPILIIAPSNLKAEAIGDKAVELTWEYDSLIGTVFSIYRRLGTGSTKIADIQANGESTITYRDESVVAGKTYKYKIKALKGSESSGFSNEVSVTVPSLGAPDGLKLETVGARSIIVSWNDNSNIEEKYMVSYTEAGKDIGTLLSYTSNTTSALITELKPRTKYKIDVIAIKGGEEARSSVLTVLTKKEEEDSMGEPTELRGVVETLNKIVLTWKDNSDSETGYKVERKVIGAGSFIVVANLGPNAEIYNDNEVSVDKIYVYRVKVFRDSEYKYSNEAEVSTVRANGEGGNGDDNEPEEPETPEEPPVIVDEPEPTEPETPGDMGGGGGGAGGDSPAENLTALFDGTEGDWAVDEIKAAYMYGLTYPDIMNKYKKNITREEFCKIAVKLYEKLSGKAATAEGNPFTDTNDPETIKANRLGIVLGIGNNLFAPERNITRQEICVMIKRALAAALGSISNDIGAEFPFSDKNKIGDWAMDAMKFCHKNNIMKGISENEIAPLNNTTREQAVVLLKRTYEKFR